VRTCSPGFCVAFSLLFVTNSVILISPSWHAIVLGVTPSRPKPPRPPPPAINNNQQPYNYEYERNYFAHLLDNNNRNVNNDANTVANADRHWTCSVCTFRNHPLLNKCEQCEMPNIETRPSSSGGATTGNLPSNNPVAVVPNNNPFVLPTATNPARVQAVDVVPGVWPGRSYNRLQQMSSASSLDNVSISSIDTNFGIMDGDEPVPTAGPGRFYPNIGAQLTNTIMLPATVVTPALCLSNAPTNAGSGSYQTQRL
jgi:Zn-finger in Ran binding protein and others